VPSGDSLNTIEERCSDKPDNKLSNKPAGELGETDPELTAVVNAWPQLPDAIRSAILALVRASIEQQER